MDWIMIGAISTAFTGLVIVITATLALLQLNEVSKSRKITAFMNICQFLQSEDIRRARGILIKTSEKGFKDWSEEEIGAAEKVCSTYDIAGAMVTKKLIEKDLVAYEWRDSIIKCWEAAKPMVNKYRETRGRDYWHSFEKIYKMAKTYS